MKEKSLRKRLLVRFLAPIRAKVKIFERRNFAMLESTPKEPALAHFRPYEDRAAY